MKTLVRALGTMVVILSGTLVNESAMAEHRTYKHGHGHRHGPIVRFGFSYGLPIYSPVPVYSPGYPFPTPIYVYPPAVIRHYASPVYFERSIVPPESAPPPPQNDWYYCADSRLYYPYAAECPGGWTRVPAQPPTR